MVAAIGFSTGRHVASSQWSRRQPYGTHYRRLSFAGLCRRARMQTRWNLRRVSRRGKHHNWRSFSPSPGTGSPGSCRKTGSSEPSHGGFRGMPRRTDSRGPLLPCRGWFPCPLGLHRGDRIHISAPPPTVRADQRQWSRPPWQGSHDKQCSCRRLLCVRGFCCTASSGPDGSHNRQLRD